MKKAVLITGIIWAIAMGVSMIIFGILSIIYVAAANSPEAIAQAAQAAKVTEEEAKAVAVAIALFMVVATIYCITGLVFSIVFAATRNKEFGKGKGIALGIIGAILGAELPGIFYIIDSAKTRQ